MFSDNVNASEGRWLAYKDQVQDFDTRDWGSHPEFHVWLGLENKSTCLG